MQTIKNKKILFVCCETFSVPLYFIAEKYKAHNEIGFVFVSVSESLYNKTIDNSHTIYKFIDDFPEAKHYNIKDIIEEFIKKSHNFDESYLEFIESKYSNYKNLNLQLVSDQVATQYGHNRKYYNKIDFQSQNKWIELNYKKLINVVEDFKPDLVLDINNDNLQRTILAEILNVKNIPYITLEHPRIGLLKIPTFNIGTSQDKYLLDSINNMKENNFLNSSFALKYIKNANESEKIMSVEYKNSRTSQYYNEPLVKSIKFIIKVFFRYLHLRYFSNNANYIRKKIMINTNEKKLLIHHIKVTLKRRYLLRKNIYFENPTVGEKYVYMPLHLIPESSTSVKAPFYINELSIIEAISKSLPIGWKLYVKEHQSMLGERSLKFYKKVKEFYNVKLVQLNYYKDPKPWIMNSLGVALITGTTALEAVILGKKAIIFGTTPFETVEGITKIRYFSELPEKIKQFTNIQNPTQNKSLIAYLEFINEIGVEVNINKLIDLGTKKLKNKSVNQKEFEHELYQLDRFYQQALKIWYNYYV
jgi:hypothetical protein